MHFDPLSASFSGGFPRHRNLSVILRTETRLRQTLDVDCWTTKSFLLSQNLVNFGLQTAEITMCIATAVRVIGSLFTRRSLNVNQSHFAACSEVSRIWKKDVKYLDFLPVKREAQKACFFSGGFTTTYRVAHKKGPYRSPKIWW